MAVAVKLKTVTRPQSNPKNHCTLHTGGHSSIPASRRTALAKITIPLINKSANATFAMYVFPETKQNSIAQSGFKKEYILSMNMPEPCS